MVISGCLNRRSWKLFFTSDDKKTVNDTLKLLDIDHLKNRCYRELSGGQQQRVLLARALCATKSLLLLDEPVAGLDPVVTNDMYEIISKLNREKNITVIMISHDIESSIKYASHILHLNKKQLFFGTAEKYKSSGAAFTFLGGEKV